MRRKTKGSIVTAEDLRRFSGAVSHSGKAYSEVLDEVIQLDDESYCFGMFLTNIEEDLLKEGINLSKLTGKKDTQINNYLQGKIDSIIERYMEEYNIDVDFMIGKEKFVIDKSKYTSPFSIYTIQHLLRVNGYELGRGEVGESTKKFNQEVLSKNSKKVDVPIIFRGRSLDEKLILNRFRGAELLGHSRIEEMLQKQRKKR